MNDTNLSRLALLAPTVASPFDANCPSRVVLDHITSKWGVLVIVALSQGSMRWGELHRGIEGISEKMLAHTLRLLEADGFVDRQSQGTVPPRVDYSLTPTGHELAGMLVPLVSWVGEHVGMPPLVPSAQPS